MGLFKRKHEDGPKDVALTFMSEAQATSFRSLVRTVFAESGREVVVFADHVVDDAGGQFGLWNLAALCAPAPAKEWRKIIQKHVDRIGEQKADLDELDDAAFRAGLYLRLVEAASLPHREWYPYAEDVSPDLVSLLSIDLPDSVATPAEDALRARGPIDELVAQGRANLRALLESDQLDAEKVRPDAGGAFTVVMGDSFFTASLSLLLNDTTWRFGNEIDDGRGVLVAVPNRHLLGYRVIDGPDAAAGLNHLFGLAIRSYGEAPGPLSPHVFWVRDGEWTQVTSFDEEGRPCVDVSQELAEALSIED